MTPGKVGRFVVASILAAACLVPVARAEHKNPGSVTLSWTAPGDDGWQGRAAIYDLRYSTLPIDETNFEKSLRLATVPNPGKGGTPQRFIIQGLDPHSEHFFAIKARDESGNWSNISNVVHLPIGFKASKGPPTKLIFLPPNPNPAHFETHFSLELPVTEFVEIDAHDVHGRRIRTILRGSLVAGVTEVTWDLKDDAGRPVPAGVYLLRGQFGGKAILRRVSVVR